MLGDLINRLGDHIKNRLSDLVCDSELFFKRLGDLVYEKRCFLRGLGDLITYETTYL